MSSTTQSGFAKDSWQTPRNARTLQAFMALRQSEIGERIAKLREQRGNPPQETVAHQLGVSHRAYQTWEAGDAKPSYPNLEKLAEFFGVTEEFILTGTNDPAAERRAEQSQLDRIERRLDEIQTTLEVLSTSRMRELLAQVLDERERKQGGSTRKRKPKQGEQD